MVAMTAPPSPALISVVGEVEGHVAEAGWDQPAQLFALVDTEELLRAEPQLAESMGLVVFRPGSLTPIAQDDLGDGPLDEQLSSMVFGTEVLGVVLVHEVLVTRRTTACSTSSRGRRSRAVSSKPR